MAVSFRAEQAANKRKTWGLLALMFIALVAAIWAIGTLLHMQMYWLVPLAVGISLVGVWSAYWKSDTLVLTMTGAKVISHEDAPQLYNIVEEITMAAGLPMPKVAIVEDPAPNAFATGRDPEHAVIAFTTGILAAMDREQLQGVAAHEMAHVGNRDTLVMAVAATTAGLLAIVADLGARAMFFGGGRRDNNNPIAMIVSIAILILAPIAALLLRAAISRKREALADATAVQFTRNPSGLRRALETLQSDTTVVHQKSTAVAHVWIESPLDGKSRSMFDTHPPLSERIALLKEMEGMSPGTDQ
ncbi:MAG: M48 family metallopeptidase [Candidatus Nanopelagicales bacterium]|nr:M48 family metallopeptidase [Candidatus Nanopelagicales bacterium]